MIRLIALAFALIYPCVVNALAVQTAEVTQVYGHLPVLASGNTQAFFLDPGSSKKDVEHTVNTYIKKNNIGAAMLIGDGFTFVARSTATRSVLSQIKLDASTFDGPVYILSDFSVTAANRANAIRTQLGNVEEFHADNEYDFRLLAIQLNKKPPGFIFVNAFNLIDSWGHGLTFKDAERFVVESNKVHTEVGICHAHFKTALAVGPLEDELKAVIGGGSTDSVCASLRRLSELGKRGQYTQHIGKFKRVIPDN